MNQKNSLDINICFGEQKNPVDLFKEWYEEAKKSEINDPNAVAVATSDNNSIPSVRMVLLKELGTWSRLALTCWICREDSHSFIPVPTASSVIKSNEKLFMG